MRAMIDWVKVEERVCRRAAYWWAIARALLALLGPGAVAEARRRLWEAVRSRPDLKRYAGRAWRPSWWYPLLYRRPVAAAGLASALLITISVGIGLVLAPALKAASVVASSQVQPGRAISFMDRLDLQSLFLSVAGLQATFLAVVAPVAVALVSLLTGQTLRRRERVELFIADTEVTAAATFWLILLALSLLASVTLPSLNPPCAFAIGFAVFLFALWNIWVLGVFLLRAVAFIRPAGEDEALRRQLVRRYWLEEAAPKLAADRLINLRDVSDHDHRPFEYGPDTVLLDREKRSEFQGRTVIVPSALSVIRDIHDTTILAVIDAVRARNERTDNPAEITFVVWGAHDLAFGATIAGERVLAAHTRRLTRLEMWLVRRSFRFEPAGAAPSPLTGERLLEELFADARDDLVQNDPSLDDRLARIAALHGFLLRLASVREDDERHGTFAGEAARSWFGTLPGNWAGTANELYRAAAKGLPGTLRSFAAVANLPRRIGYAAGPKVPPAALVPSDKLLRDFAFRLFDRGVEVSTSPLAQVPARQPMQLPASAQAWYAEAWDSFADGCRWLRRVRTPESWPSGTDASGWAECRRFLPPLESHLACTTDILARAAAFGDSVAAERMREQLFSWPDDPFASLLPDDTSNAAIAMDLTKVAPGLLQKADWQTVVGALPIEEWLKSIVVEPSQVFRAALCNHFVDEVRALAAVLLRLASKAGAESPAGTVLREVMTGPHPDEPPSNRESRHLFHRAFAPTDFLRGLADRVGDAGSRLDLHPDTVSRIGRAAAEGTAGRAGGGGRGDLAARIAGAYCPLLVLLALRTGPEAWPTQPERLGLTEAAPKDADAAALFEALAKTTQELAEPVTETISGIAGVDADAVAKAKERVSATCREIARQLRDRTETVRRTAPLDPARLDAIVEAAASLAFRKDTAAPPVLFFGEIALARNEQEHAIRLELSYRRGQLTKPLVDAPPENEKDDVAEKMRGTVAVTVLDAILPRIPNCLRVSSPEAWRDALIAWRKSIGWQEPLLFLGRPWPPTWARDGGVGSAIATRLNNPSPPPKLRDRTPFLEGVRIVPVIRDAKTFLAPACMFRRLTFGAPEGKLVTVAVEDRKDGPDHVLLTLRASFSLELDRPERALILETIADDPA